MARSESRKSADTPASTTMSRCAKCGSPLLEGLLKAESACPVCGANLFAPSKRGRQPFSINRLRPILLTGLVLAAAAASLFTYRLNPLDHAATPPPAVVPNPSPEGDTPRTNPVQTRSELARIERTARIYQANADADSGDPTVLLEALGQWKTFVDFWIVSQGALHTTMELKPYVQAAIRLYLAASRAPHMPSDQSNLEAAASWLTHVCRSEKLGLAPPERPGPPVQESADLPPGLRDARLAKEILRLAPHSAYGYRFHARALARELPLSGPAQESVIQLIRRDVIQAHRLAHSKIGRDLADAMGPLTPA